MSKNDHLFYANLHRGKAKTPRIPHVMLHGVEHKSCSKCGSLKPLDQFNSRGKNSKQVEKLHSECKDCAK